MDLPLWLLLFVVCQGCATTITGVKITDLRRSLVTIIQAVEYALPGGVTQRSQNERTFYSAYFPPNGSFKVDAASAPERARCKILVFNARRPYAISFQCKVQEDRGGVYTDVGRSDPLARRVKKRFLQYLASRPEKTDFVDDFRIF